jgi:hypothetical protein
MIIQDWLGSVIMDLVPLHPKKGGGKLHATQSFLKKLTVAQLFEKFLSFYESEI